MKVELHHYTHAENFIALNLIGETEIEKAILAAMWKHGQLELTHHNFSITWKRGESEKRGD